MRKSKLCKGKRIGCIMISAILVFSLNATVFAEDIGRTKMQNKINTQTESQADILIGSEIKADTSCVMSETEETEIILEIETETNTEKDAEIILPTETNRNLIKEPTDEILAVPKIADNTSVNVSFDEMWEYRINEEDQTVLLTRYIGEATDVIVPAKVNVDGKEYAIVIAASGESTVHLHPEGVFDQNNDITSVQFTKGSRIEENNMEMAFFGCTNLKSVLEIPSGVTDMGSTFYGCSSLTQAPEIPSSVTNMGSTFYGCSSLTQAPEIPLSVTNMGSTFFYCSSLAQAPEIPSSVTNMESTFLDCSSITKAPEIPSRVRNMWRTFYGCSSITKAPEIPSSVTNMGSTFRGCSNLKQAPEIPSRVSNMESTFFGCSSITKAPEIPSSVRNMESTFSDCSSITKAPEIPSSVTDMSHTFFRCISITEAPEIPSSVTFMRGTFSGCSSITKAPEIPSRVTDMSYAFSDCSSITKAPEIPSSVKYMEGTFSGCNSLTKAPEIPSSVTYMRETFYNCNNLAGELTINMDTRNENIWFEKCFYNAATYGKGLMVNYSSNCTKIDDIIATKGSSSKITKGRNVDSTPLPTGTYTILFDTNGCSQAPAPITVTNGKPYGTLPTPTRQYYKFLGWYTSKSGGSRVTADTRVLTEGNHTLYARWSGTAYKVSYNANGGKSSVKSKLVNYGSAYGPLTSPVRKGYKFKGWYTSKKGGKKVTSATGFTTAKNITLYARWDKISVKKAAPIQLKNKKSKQMTGTIKRVRGVKGYQIVYGLNKSVTKSKKSFLSTSAKFTIKKLKKGRTYYVKARGYAVDSAGRKVYGSYSAVKSLKIKK